MFKVEYWSYLLDKYIIKAFDTISEAQEFAIKKHGIIIA